MSTVGDMIKWGTNVPQPIEANEDDKLEVKPVLTFPSKPEIRK